MHYSGPNGGFVTNGGGSGHLGGHGVVVGDVIVGVNGGLMHNRCLNEGYVADGGGSGHI